MRKVILPTEDNVKIIGRTIMLDDCRLLCASGSGIEFEYTGSTLKVTFMGDSSADGDGDVVNWRDIPRVQVIVDGRIMLDTTIKKSKEIYTVYGEDAFTPIEKHVVRILKLSEPRMSSVGVGEIEVECDGDIRPTKDKERFVEFIGDSITCGYGVDTQDELCLFSTSTENATRAFAYMAAQELDVDYSLVSYSGHGFISGYTPDPNIPKPEELIQPYYELVAYSYNNFRGTSPQDTKWDFGHQPDAIVINIGTNDYSYTQGDAKKTSQYEKAYIEFLKEVRKLNAKAHIICSVGIMGDELYPAIERVVDKYISETGDGNISSLKFDVQNPVVDGYCADYHPSAATQKKAAAKMASELKKWL